VSEDPEAELRAIWNAQGIPQAQQDALIADVSAKAQPGARVGPFIIGPAYYVEYRNQRRLERTRMFPTLQEALDSADFLRFQGAKRINVREHP
jgi:hypothetical protein